TRVLDRFTVAPSTSTPPPYAPCTVGAVAELNSTVSLDSVIVPLPRYSPPPRASKLGVPTAMLLSTVTPVSVTVAVWPLGTNRPPPSAAVLEFTLSPDKVTEALEAYNPPPLSLAVLDCTVLPDRVKVPPVAQTPPPAPAPYPVPTLPRWAMLFTTVSLD